MIHNSYAHQDIVGGIVLEDGRKLSMDDMDFLTEDIPVKKRLRPFIIWYGEKLREINGAYYWINRAFEDDAAGEDNIIITDLRRTAELEIFMNSNSFKRRSELGFAAASSGATVYEEAPVIDRHLPELFTPSHHAP